MLKSLNIRNLAVIDKIEIDFQGGLNLLTGETGSGKSIIVDALGLLLGDRGSTTQIRTGEDHADVEGLFLVEGDERDALVKVLDDVGIDSGSDGEVLVRREVNVAGRNRVFVNDRSVTLATLKELQPFLVEIHGQGDQRLLRSSLAQTDLLDAYAGCGEERLAVKIAYDRWKSASDELHAFVEQVRDRESTRDLLQYQLSEIDSVAPKANEEEDLLAQRKLMAHAEKILQLGGGAVESLYENDDSVTSRLAGIQKQIDELCDIDPTLSGLRDSLSEVEVVLTDVAGSLRSYCDGIDFSSEAFNSVDERLVEIERLKRKFGIDIAGVLDLRESLAQKLSILDDASARETELRKKLDESRSDYHVSASKLSAARSKAAPKFAKAVTKDLKHLALEQAAFIVEVASTSTDALDSNSVSNSSAEPGDSESTFTPYGIDRVRFLFSANPGEDVRPMSHVASGGELSRLMLALRTIGKGNLSTSIGNETVVFDEIDAGIGGRVAEAVGRRLKSLSANHQVLCVTHQAQIARFADAHFVVSKSIRKGRTMTEVRLLEDAERVSELARMIGGNTEAQTTIDTARWLLTNASEKARGASE